ncbi:MAG: helix-turn-helix domain-containing protein [Pseudonocardiaceae bacterium]
MAKTPEGTSVAAQSAGSPVVRWNLRRVMAEKGMFATTDLLGPLAERGVEISRQMVHRVVTKPPQRINLDLLAALCDILDCTPNDIIEIAYEQQARPEPAEQRGPGIGDLRPIRAKVRRPNQ